MGNGEPHFRKLTETQPPLLYPPPPKQHVATKVCRQIHQMIKAGGTDISSTGYRLVFPDIVTRRGVGGARRASVGERRPTSLSALFSESGPAARLGRRRLTFKKVRSAIHQQHVCPPPHRWAVASRQDPAAKFLAVLAFATRKNLVVWFFS